MTSKQYLLQIRETNERIDDMMLTMRRACKKAQPRSRKLEEGQPRLSDMQAQVNREVSRLRQYQKDMCAVIAQLPNDNMRTLLTLRYLCGMPWDQVAKRMHYSSRHLHRMHREALELLDGIKPRRQ